MEAPRDEVTRLRQYSWDEAEPGWRPAISQFPCSASPHTSQPSCPRTLWDSSVPLGANQAQTALFGPLGPPSAGLVQALPSLQLSSLPLISGCLPTATQHLPREFSTHTHLQCHMLTKAAVELIPWDTPQKRGGVLGWFEQRPTLPGDSGTHCVCLRISALNP